MSGRCCLDSKPYFKLKANQKACGLGFEIHFQQRERDDCHFTLLKASFDLALDSEETVALVLPADQSCKAWMDSSKLHIGRMPRTCQSQVIMKQ